jgi:hypothetical protein
MRTKRRDEAEEIALRQKLQDEALQAIDQFERFQSVAALRHMEVRNAGLNVRYMATRIGILVVEGGSGTLGHFIRPRYLLPGWVRIQITARSDSREIRALLSQELLGGTFNAREAEKEFRAVLDQGPMDVSVFVEDWDAYAAKTHRAPVLTWQTGEPDDDHDAGLDDRTLHTSTDEAVTDDGEFDPRDEPAVTLDPDLPEDSGVMDHADPFWRA